MAIRKLNKVLRARIKKVLQNKVDALFCVSEVALLELATETRQRAALRIHENSSVTEEDLAVLRRFNLTELGDRLTLRFGGNVRGRVELPEGTNVETPKFFSRYCYDGPYVAMTDKDDREFDVATRILAVARAKRLEAVVNVIDAATTFEEALSAVPELSAIERDVFKPLDCAVAALRDTL